MIIVPDELKNSKCCLKCKLVDVEFTTKEIKVGTFNIWELKEPGKREQVESYMKRNQIIRNIRRLIASQELQLSLIRAVS